MCHPEPREGGVDTMTVSAGVRSGLQNSLGTKTIEPQASATDLRTFSSPAAEVLPSVGPLSPRSPTQKGHGCNVRAAARRWRVRNASACHAAGERFKFQVGRADA